MLVAGCQILELHKEDVRVIISQYHIGKSPINNEYRLCDIPLADVMSRTLYCIPRSSNKILYTT